VEIRFLKKRVPTRERRRAELILFFDVFRGSN